MLPVGPRAKFARFRPVHVPGAPSHTFPCLRDRVQACCHTISELVQTFRSSLGAGSRTVDVGKRFREHGFEGCERADRRPFDKLIGCIVDRVRSTLGRQRAQQIDQTRPAHRPFVRRGAEIMQDEIARYRRERRDRKLGTGRRAVRRRDLGAACKPVHGSLQSARQPYCHLVARPVDEPVDRAEVHVPLPDDEHACGSSRLDCQIVLRERRGERGAIVRTFVGVAHLPTDPRQVNARPLGPSAARLRHA